MSNKLVNGAVVRDPDKIRLYETSRALKGYNTTRNKLQSQIKKLRNDISYAEAQIPILSEQIKEINEKITALTENGVVVSEHALLRYIERHKGINLDEIAEELKSLPPECYVQRGNTIVTIIEEKDEQLIS